MQFAPPAFVASLLTSLALLAAACGDDTGGSGGGGGGDATSSTGSSSGITASCEDAADFSVETAADLGCNAVDRAEFVAECEAAYGDSPQCAGDLDAFVSCLIALPSGSWTCDPATDELGPPDTACPSEAQALVSCLQG